MKHALWTKEWLGKLTLVSALFLACGCGADTGEEDDGEDSTPNLILLDDNNYTSVSSISIPTVETASATDLDICWTDVVSDLQCHDVSPQADLDNVALLRLLNLTEDEIEQRLTAGNLQMSDIDGYIDFKTDHEETCTKLSAMTLLGTKIDVAKEYVANDNNTYLLVFTHGTSPGVGARTMLFIKPTTDSTNTTINAQSACGFLEFTPDIASATPVQVPIAGPWRVSWRELTRDGGGNPLEFTAIDGLLLGYYENTTVADIEADIFDLELNATSLWEIKLDGESKTNLALAQDRVSGELFSGFDRAPGVWLLALTCSTCQNPAPLLLTVLEPN